MAEDLAHTAGLPGTAPPRRPSPHSAHRATNYSTRSATGAWGVSLAPAMLPSIATSPSSCCPSATRPDRRPPSVFSALGVDSGPLHLARFTEVPCVGVWMPGHYPTTYSVPRRQQLNVVLAEPTRAWNRYKRILWRIVEQPGGAFEAGRLADWCARMLGPRRYLDPDEPAADMPLQQFVGERCRGVGGNALSACFLQRFPAPIDILYLDALDTTEPGHAEHAQRELQAALPRLHSRSLVLIDDTPWTGGAWVGKGARAVPWLLAHGWRILYGGYQVLLERQSRPSMAAD
jgi:hypothetical protein